MAAGATFIDGFDHYDTVAMLEKKWTTVNDNGISFAAQLRGAAGGSLVLPGGASVDKTTDTSGSNVDTNPIGFYAQRDDTVDRILFSAYFNSTLQCKVVWKADGSFDIYDGTNTVNATSTKKANGVNTPYHFELAMQNATTSSNGNFFIDGLGSVPANLSFANIVRSARIILGGDDSGPDSAGVTFTYDHLFVKSTSGGQIGPAEILTSFADADGVTDNFTSSQGGAKYLDINENPPDESTYNFAATNSISQFWKFPVVYPPNYTPSGFGLTVLGSVAATQAMSGRYSNTDGGSEISADNISSAFALGSLFVEFLFNSNPVLVSDHGFVGMRRTS